MATGIQASATVTYRQPLKFPLSERLVSVDLMRGIAMILMALDHVRDYMTYLTFPPEDMSHTFPALFVTRFVTHYCAPAFFFLAGTGAYLSVARGKTPAQLSKFLWTRGLWLIFLEWTVIYFAWTFRPFAPVGIVIWALGCSMIALSLLVRLPMKWIAVIGLGMVIGHNAFDRVTPESFGRLHGLWSVLHVPGLAFWIIPGKLPFFALYPLVPWIGVMACGYCFGALMQRSPEHRSRLAMQIGLAMIVAFVVLRLTGIYGNPPADLNQGVPLGYGGFHVQNTVAMTLVSFFNTAKYPPSLQYLLMTLGPAIFAIGVFDRYRLNGPVAKAITVYGRVPMFYYILHLFGAHILAIMAAVVMGQPYQWLLHGSFFTGQAPPGYGHGLPFIYLMWATLIFILYWPCRWFAEVKKRRRDWWLSYI